MQKTNYITNKELLKEIHNSKVSYCSYLEPRYADYDAIVFSTSDINEELIEKVIEKKSKPRTRGVPKNAPVTPPTREDLVFRVMTDEHIPLDPTRKRKAKDKGDGPMPARTNFPPFKHYAFIDGDLREVCRSHWRGTIAEGEFSQEHGKMTRRLADMFMLLVQRYALRGNFRGYTYNDEMQSLALLQLSQVGLYFNEAKGDNPFAFYTTAIRNCFVRVLLVERKAQSFRDDLLIAAGQTPSFTRQIESEIEQRAAWEAAHKAVPVPGVRAKTART